MTTEQDARPSSPATDGVAAEAGPGAAPALARPIWSGGEWLVEALVGQGVGTVFGIPGVHNLAIYEALRRRPAVRHILARHEQGAAFMADGYARASGRPGVALVTSGPAALNTLTPLGEAYTDSSPVLVIATNVERRLLETGRGTLHELRDQPGAFRAVIGRCERVLDADELAPAFARAWAALAGPRPRPAALDIPHDVLDEATAVAPLPLPPRRCRLPEPELLRRAAELLGGARAPLLLAGGGVAAAGAAPQVLALAERLGAPVVTTLKGKGAIPEDHPLALGYLGSGRGPVARLLRERDVVLAVGSRFAGGTGSNWRLPCPQTLIRLDADPVELGGPAVPTLALLGDARCTLAALLAALGPGRADPDPTVVAVRQEALAEARAAAPWRCAVLEAVRAALPAEGILCTDMTMVGYAAYGAYPALAPRTLLAPSGFGTLGFAFPAALGAKAAAPERPVVALVGDGGFQFTLPELATAVQHRLGVAILLINDRCYSSVKGGQQRRYGEASAVDLVNPDFQRLAAAYGIPSCRLDGPAGLTAALREAVGRDLPTLIELPAGT